MYTESQELQSTTSFKNPGVRPQTAPLWEREREKCWKTEIFGLKYWREIVPAPRFHGLEEPCLSHHPSRWPFCLVNMGFLSRGAQLLKSNMSGECQGVHTTLHCLQAWRTLVVGSAETKVNPDTPSHSSLDELRLQTPPQHLSHLGLLQQNQERERPSLGASSSPSWGCGLLLPRGRPFPDNVPILGSALSRRVVWVQKEVQVKKVKSRER